VALASPQACRTGRRFQVELILERTGALEPVVGREAAEVGVAPLEEAEEAVCSARLVGGISENQGIPAFQRTREQWGRSAWRPPGTGRLGTGRLGTGRRVLRGAAGVSD
jgi:hypothetical protein